MGMGIVMDSYTDAYGTKVTTYFTDSRKEAEKLLEQALGADFAKIFPSVVFKYRVAIHRKGGKR